MFNLFIFLVGLYIGGFIVTASENVVDRWSLAAQWPWLVIKRISSKG